MSLEYLVVPENMEETKRQKSWGILKGNRVKLKVIPMAEDETI